MASEPSFVPPHGVDSTRAWRLREGDHPKGEIHLRPSRQGQRKKRTGLITIT